MFRLFRFAVLSALLLTALPTVNARKHVLYDKEWQNVDSLVKKEKYQIKAIDAVRDILDKATADNNQYEMLRSTLMLNRLDAYNANSSFSASSYLRFDSLQKKLDDNALKAICHYLQAVCLQDLARKNYFRQAAGGSLGMSLENVRDTIIYHFEQSFKLAGRARTKDYTHFIPDCTDSYIKLRPRLRDVLLDNACINIGNTSGNNHYISDILTNDDRLLGTAPEFLQAISDADWENPHLWQLHTLKLLTENNLKADADIRATIDLKRLKAIVNDIRFLNDWVHVSEMIEKLADSYIADSYINKSIYSADLYVLAARVLTEHFIDDSWTDKEQRSQKSLHAQQLLNKALEIRPDGETAYDCQVLYNQLKRRSISIQFERMGRAGQSELGILSFRNIDKVFIRALKYDPDRYHFYSYTLYNERNLPQLLNKMEECTRWSVSTAHRNDYIEHSMWISLPPLERGEYIIQASADSTFADETLYSCRLFTSSRITFTPSYLKENDNDCRLTGFLSDAAGNALANCSYTLCGYDEDDNEFTVSGRTKADGFLDITFIRKSDGDLELMVEHNGETDTLSFESLHQQYRYNTFSSGPLHLKLNTDRAIYRPGDTVRFSGIVSEILPRLQGHVLSGADIAVYTTGTRNNMNFILQTTSDAHGQFTGQWVIPADIRPGWAFLRAIVIPHQADPDSIIEIAEDREEFLAGDEIEIKIQSYSRPLLELTFDELPSPPAPGDTVECSGSIKTPLGIAVSGARIQWSTSIYTTEDYSLAPVGSRTILESGETQTAANGTFVIRFLADVPANKEIQLTARVTDSNGETHEYYNFVYVRTDNNLGLRFQYHDVIKSPADTVFQIQISGYPATGRYRLKVEALTPESHNGINIYDAFNVREVDSKEMSEYALLEGTLPSMFPQYGFIPGKDSLEVAYTLLDSVIEYTNREWQYITVPGIKTGHYRVSFLDNPAISDSPWDRSVNDIFVSVGKAEDTLSVKDLLWAKGKKVILHEGDTANFRIGSPYPGTVIHYEVLNRDTTLLHGTMIADGLLHNISLPVSEDICGNVLLVATAQNGGLSIRKLAAQYIPFYSKYLKYELTTFRSTLTSGAQESWTFRFVDRKGTPVKASVLLDMYDSVLDKLQPHKWEYYPWKYGNFTEHNPIRIINAYRNESKPENPAPYRGKKILGLNIANPLSTPIEALEGLPIPLREASSSVSALNSIEIVTDNIGMIADDSDQAQPIGNAATGLTTVRKNLSHTGLFMTGLETNANGYVTVNFKAPELLTRWNLRVIAYTDDLQTAGVGGYVTTTRQLMVEPAAPRFFRTGDVTDFVQKVTNAGQSDIEATVKVSFTDDAGQRLDLTAGDSVRTVKIEAGRSASVSFNLTIPDGTKEITYSVTATAGDYSDGQQETIPVLSDRIQVTRSTSLFNNGGETRVFHTDAAETSATGKVFDEQLTLQYHSNPIWYAIDALPSLTGSNGPDNISILYDFVAHCMNYFIAFKYPALAQRLEINLSNEKDLENTVDSYINDLRNRRNPDGGWPWMPGGASSPYITSLVLYALDYLEMTSEYCYLEGLRYLAADTQVRTNHLSHLDIMFLYLYSRQSRARIVDPQADQTFNALLEEAAKRNYKNEDLYYRALLIQMFASTGKTDMAQRIVKDLLASSEYTDELGRYWPQNRGGYLWNQAPIETQAIIIRALKAAGYDREADEAARWLLKQKETTAWESTPATAAALMALLETASGSLPDADSHITVTVGGERIDSKTDGDTDGYMSRTWNGPVTPDKAEITVTSTAKGISWGALYHTFTQNLDDVESSSNGMTLKRTLYRIIRDSQGERLEEITPGTRLNKGDRMKVKLSLTTDRTYEYLQLKSGRAASLEPVSTDAGYTYNITNDILYYRAPTNTSDDLYIERLEPGTYTIEYDLYVQRSGLFSMGTATIRCLYAPSYRAITKNVKLGTVPNFTF